MKMIKATGKAAQIHLVDLHFINRVAIPGNHEKPIREGFFHITVGHRKGL